MPEESTVIRQLPVERNEMGFWTHPAWPRDGDEDLILKTWLTEQGLEVFCSEMESDGPKGTFEPRLMRVLATTPPGCRASRSAMDDSSSRSTTRGRPDLRLGAAVDAMTAAIKDASAFGRDMWLMVRSTFDYAAEANGFG